MSDTPSFEEWVTQAIENHMVEVHTSLPAIVVSYDKAKQTVSVQPAIKHGVVDNETDVRTANQLPVINNVPVEFPGAGEYSITFPINKGDTGMLCFAESSIDKWKTRGGVVDPLDDRRFNLSDATFRPGLRASNAVIPSDGVADGAMVLRAPEVKIGAGSGHQATFKADAFMSAINALLTSIASAVSGIAGTGPQTVAGTAITTAKTVFDSTINSNAKTSIAKVK